MSFQTYQELQDQVAAWVGRSDARFLGRIPAAIELVEAGVRRRLRHMRNEETETLPVLSGGSSVALPAMFIGLRAEPEIDDGTGRTLRAVASPFVQDEEIELGLPDVYYIAGNSLHFRPAADGDVSLRIHYYAGLHPLTDELPANWLLAYHPHVYFYGTLAEMFKFAGERQRRDKWLKRFERAIGDVMDIDALDRWNGTPMAMQSRVVPLDSPLLSIADQLAVVTGIPNAGAVARQGLAVTINFPVMTVSAQSQDGLDLAANINFPVMSVSASLAPPGEIEANINFPVMTVAATFESEVTLVSEDFQGTVGSWNLNTPGVDEPQTAFSRDEDATPTSSTGPSGGSNPANRAATAGNGYAFTEASGVAGPWSMESPDLDASLGTITLTFDLHMRFGSLGGIGDGTLTIQGWNGTAWSTISSTIVGSQQTAAADAWLASTGFGTYDSTGFSNVDFKFRFLFTKGTNVNDANYDCSIDNVLIVGPPGAI